MGYMLTELEKARKEPARKGRRTAKSMRAVSRKDLLSHGGVGLIGAMLLGAAGCNRSDGKVVRFFTGTRETAALERAETALQVYRFEEQHPNIELQRETLQPDELRRKIQSRLRSKVPPDVEVMYSGFRKVIGGMRSPAEQAGALQQAWAEAKRAGKTTAQG